MKKLRKDALGVEEDLPGKYPLRTRRKAETRERIVNAALKLAGSQGAANVTMAMVADVANVHVTTLFTHFTSKTELFSGIAEPAVVLLSERIQAAKGQIDFFEFLQQAQEEFAAKFRQEENAVSQALYLRTQVELLPAWIAYEKAQLSLMADYLAHDYEISESEARLFAGMIVSANIESFDRWLSSPESTDLAEMTRSNTSAIKKIFNTYRTSGGEYGT